MNRRLRDHLELGALGLAMGFFLSNIGFDDWTEVHRMFLVSDLRLWLTFGCAVGLIGAVLFAAARSASFTPKPIHKGTVPGAALFGVGWALTGACPSIVMVQVGEGQLPALVTLAGVVVGTAIYSWARPRWFRWESGSCEL